MMKRLLAALLLMLPSTAWATCSSVPYTFVPNTLAQSGQVNANFAAVVNCANTIDAGQITTGVLPVARGGTNNPTWTTGSVVFATAPTQLGQDNANLFWDSTNKRLLIGGSAPAAPGVLQVTQTGTNTTAIAANYSTTQAAFSLSPFANGSWTMYDRVSGGPNQSITSSGGNIGIGFTPIAKLDVNGAILADEGGPGSGGYSFHQDGGQDTGMFSSADGQIQFYNNNVVTATATTTLWSFATTINTSGQYQVGGAQISAANLSNGTTGSGAIMLSANPTSSGTLTAGVVNATTYDVIGRVLANSNAIYNQIFDGSGNSAILMGGSGDQTNYYDNAAHSFRNLGGSTAYFTINSAGNAQFNFNLAANNISAGGQMQAQNYNCSNLSPSAACILDSTSGDTIVNVSSGVWFIAKNGGTGANVLVGQVNSAPTSTSGSSTACLALSAYYSGYNGLTFCASDERLKTIGDPLGDSLSLIDQLKPVNFTWKDGVQDHPRPDEALHIGFVAQDVQKIMPACVTKNPDDYLSLDSNCLIAYLAKAIQELDAKVSSK